MRYTFTKKPAKVAAAASKDLTRPALTGAWLDMEAGELRACDSYIAVRMPVALDPGDTSGWLSADALERSRKRDGGGIACNGSAVVYDTLDVEGERTPEEVERLQVATYPRPDLGQAPDLPKMWPADDAGFTVGISADLLNRLSDSLGAELGVVALTFQCDDWGRPNPLKPILARSAHGAGATTRDDGCNGLARPEGLIMPVRINA